METTGQAWTIISSIGTLLSGVGAVGVVWLSYLIWQTYRKIEFLTGALETQSELMLRLTLKDRHPDISVVWWDKSVEDFPFEGKHGQPFDLKTVRFGFPMKHRRFYSTWFGLCRNERSPAG